MGYFDLEGSHLEGYDTAQICINGHTVNSMAASSPQFNQIHCDKCGAKTIRSCPSCNTNIRGYYHAPGVVSFSDHVAPSYCHNCGHPYPWVAAGVNAAKELADELDELSADQREALKGAIDDLVKETPRSQLAVVRMKKLLPAAGKSAAEAMRKLLVDIVTEAVKKQLWP